MHKHTLKASLHKPNPKPELNPKPQNSAAACRTEDYDLDAKLEADDGHSTRLTEAFTPPLTPWCLVGNGGMDPYSSPLRSTIVVPITLRTRQLNPLRFQDPGRLYTESPRKISRFRAWFSLGIEG